MARHGRVPAAVREVFVIRMLNREDDEVTNTAI
jgi:hypothetical protein